MKIWQNVGWCAAIHAKVLLGYVLSIKDWITLYKWFWSAPVTALVQIWKSGLKCTLSLFKYDTYMYMFLFDLPTRHTHPHMICPPDIQSWKFRNTCDVFTLCLLFPALCSLCSALFLRREVWGELHLEWRGERLVMVMRVMLPVMVVSWVNTAKIFDSWKFESGSGDDKF